MLPVWWLYFEKHDPRGIQKRKDVIVNWDNWACFVFTLWFRFTLSNSLNHHVITGLAFFSSDSTVNNVSLHYWEKVTHLIFLLKLLLLSLFCNILNWSPFTIWCTIFSNSEYSKLLIVFLQICFAFFKNLNISPVLHSST